MLHRTYSTHATCKDPSLLATEARKTRGTPLSHHKDSQGLTGTATQLINSPNSFSEPSQIKQVPISATLSSTYRTTPPLSKKLEERKKKHTQTNLIVGRRQPTASSRLTHLSAPPRPNTEVVALYTFPTSSEKMPSPNPASRRRLACCCSWAGSSSVSEPPPTATASSCSSRTAPISRGLFPKAIFSSGRVELWGRAARPR